MTVVGPAKTSGNQVSQLKPKATLTNTATALPSRRAPAVGSTPGWFALSAMRRVPSIGAGMKVKADAAAGTGDNGDLPRHGVRTKCS
jgi:hypothetical protein